MKDRSKALDDLMREVERQCNGYGGVRDEALVPKDSRLREIGRVESPAERGPFGRWLVRQTADKGLLARLVKAARSDPKFPLDNDPDNDAVLFGPSADDDGFSDQIRA